MSFYDLKSPVALERRNKIDRLFIENPGVYYTVKEVARICFGNKINPRVINNLLHNNRLLSAEKTIRWSANGRKSMYIFYLKKQND